MADSKEAPLQPGMTQQIQLFTSADGQAQLQVALEHDTVWLSQAQMGQLFDTTSENILMHLKNIFNDEELAEQATTKDFLVVRQERARMVRWGAFAKANPNNPDSVRVPKRLRSRQSHPLNMHTFALSDLTHG